MFIRTLSIPSLALAYTGYYSGVCLIVKIISQGQVHSLNSALNNVFPYYTGFMPSNIKHLMSLVRYCRNGVEDQMYKSYRNKIMRNLDIFVTFCLKAEPVVLQCSVFDLKA